MKRLLTLKNLSKSFLSSPSSSSTTTTSTRAFHSLTKPPTNPTTPFSPLQQHYHHQQPQKLHGLFSNPVLSKQFATFSSHSKLPLNGLVGSRLGFVKPHFPKGNVKLSSPWSSPSQKRSWSSWARGLSGDNIVLGLILANAAVFILWRVFDRNFMYKNFMISLDNFRSGRVHTLITSAFSHIDMEHIASNMIGLYFFGNNIARVFGPEYLLKLYLAGAAVGSIFYLVHHAYLAGKYKNQGTFGRDPSRAPGLGASGAVNAIMLLDIFLFPKATLYFDFFIPVPAILLGIFLVGKDVLRIVEGNSQISGSAHLGGAAVAAAAWLRLGRRIRF